MNMNEQPQGFNPDTFDLLVRNYETRLMRVALRITGRREDAEDVVQETFLHVYPAARQSLHQQSLLAGFVNRIRDTTYLHLGLALLAATLERMIPIAGMLMSDKAPIIVGLMSGCNALSASIPRPLSTTPLDYPHNGSSARTLFQFEVTQ
jgi:hypothetical protein